MPIILKAAGAITKDFLEAASGLMNGFLKAASVSSLPVHSFQQLSET